MGSSISCVRGHPTLLMYKDVIPIISSRYTPWDTKKPFPCMVVVQSLVYLALHIASSVPDKPHTVFYW